MLRRTEYSSPELLPSPVTIRSSNLLPTSNFTLGAAVQIHLDTSITDVNSVSLSGGYTGSFTVIGDPTTTAPTPVAYSPGYGSTAQPLNVIAQVQFNQAMLASTINATNVTLYDGTLGLNVAETPALLGAGTNVVQFKPTSNLTASHVYYLYLNNVMNAQGVALPNSYYNVFTTGTTADSATPTVTSVGPPNGTTGAGINAAVILMFSKAIDPITVTGSTVSITGGAQTVVPASISFNSTLTEAIITPLAPLPGSTVMTITINGVTDTQGHSVTPLTTTFTTAAGPVLTPPTVIQYSPILQRHHRDEQFFRRSV